MYLKNGGALSSARVLVQRRNNNHRNNTPCTPEQVRSFYFQSPCVGFHFFFSKFVFFFWVKKKKLMSEKENLGEWNIVAQGSHTGVYDFEKCCSWQALAPSRNYKAISPKQEGENE